MLYHFVVFVAGFISCYTIHKVRCQNLVGQIVGLPIVKDVIQKEKQKLRHDLESKFWPEEAKAWKQLPEFGLEAELILGTIPEIQASSS